MNIKDEAVELKPCPFCASRVLNQFNDDDNHIIECAQCGCEIRNTQHHKVSSYWNRRAPTPVGVTDVGQLPTQQEVETLREGIKEIAERERGIRDNWARHEESTKARILELETDLEIERDKGER